MGPVILLTVPPIKARLGYKPQEPIPLSYPGPFASNSVFFLCLNYVRSVPNRPRRPVQGYDDE
jgi:hypothetical protein